MRNECVKKTSKVTLDKWQKSTGILKIQNTAKQVLLICLLLPDPFGTLNKAAAFSFYI